MLIFYIFLSGAKITLLSEGLSYSALRTRNKVFAWKKAAKATRKGRDADARYRSICVLK